MRPCIKYQIIEDFVNGLAPSSKISYRSHMNNFFSYLKVDPQMYLNNGRDYNQDVLNYAYNVMKNKPPKTQQAELSTIKGFFTHYDISLRPSIWDTIRKRNHIKNRTITEDFVPTNEELKKVLIHTTNCKDRALFTFCATTGMRIDEVLSIEVSDINWEMRHVHIRESISKTRTERDTFFTEEVKTILLEWLKERPKFLTNSFRKSPYVRKHYESLGYTFQKKDNVWIAYKDGRQFDITQLEDRIFPFHYTNAVSMHNNMVEKAGAPYNEKDNNEKLKDNRYKYHIHCYRKFWETAFASTRAPKAHIDYMIGHESQLDRTYIKFKLDDLKKTYDKFSYCLSIFSDKKQFMEQTMPEIQQQKTTIASLMSEMHEMRLVMREYEKVIDDKIALKIAEDKAKREAYEQALQDEYEWQQQILKEYLPKNKNK